MSNVSPGPTVYLVPDNTVFDHTDERYLHELFGSRVDLLIQSVWDFMVFGGQLRMVGHPDQVITFGDDPKTVHRRRRRQWLADANEGEVGEFLTADFANDLIEYIDGAIDVPFIAIGALIEAVDGNPYHADLLLKEVCRSNYTKLVECEVRGDGKVVKGPHYQAPRIRLMLEHFGIHIPEPTKDDTFMAVKEKKAPPALRAIKDVPQS